MLGIIHFDLVLVILILSIYIVSGDNKIYSDNICYRRMTLLIIVIICITPFAEWPGSVLRVGLTNFIKGIVFFFFTTWFLINEKRVKIFLLCFVLFQSFRVVEPLYLHMTQGYWGDTASMANWTFMYRLSGSPSDVINPNGLAFVILTIIPFLLPIAFSFIVSPLYMMEMFVGLVQAFVFVMLSAVFINMATTEYH